MSDDDGVPVLDRVRRALRRALARRGYEREVLVVIVKCALAATLAWAVGSQLVSSSQVGFAPFSALLVVRPSVYGSVLQSGRYVAAVVLGALLAGAIGLTVGAQLWVFPLILLAALSVGYVPWFGEQGQQIPVVTAFALAGGTASSAAMLGELLAMVCVGSACALAVNLLLAPAIRFRDAEMAVLDFSDGLRDLNRDMARGCREGEEGVDAARWERRATGFDETARNARTAVARQEERVRLNPRRLVAGPARAVDLSRYRSWINALERSARHVQSLTRTLRNAVDGRVRSRPEEGFLNEFAGVLDSAADAFQAVHDAEEPERESVSADLAARVDEGRRRLDEARRWIEGEREPRRASLYTSLLTDVERLYDELCAGEPRQSA
ncbi:aromatic acid exporter family protein [Nocardiopsis sp. CNT312]|uniref:FUSC family protein n=1 Tax=Nocardiopsis sp. CNT312 TaxID=1137268 RepID=UPI00048BC360|nr:aromatic acid exporter family protein [Nocardiopsis sp. CNT312]